MPGDIRICAISDPGLKRSSNEDNMAWWWPDTAAAQAERGLFLIVCDGMGGALAGERASQLAVETIMRSWREAPGIDAAAELEAAFEEANAIVHSESKSDASRTGMGTTGTAVVLRGGDILVAHVGDSRAYLLTRGGLRQLTSDHSLVAHLVERGQLTPEEARSDPRRNVVTRSIGVTPVVEVDVVAFAAAFEPGDTLLLSSDGLHGVVEDEVIAALLAGDDLDAAGRKLIEDANRLGGPDNITVILARREARQP